MHTHRHELHVLECSILDLLIKEAFHKHQGNRLLPCGTQVNTNVIQTFPPTHSKRHVV